jgi:hypothetical protein
LFILTSCGLIFEKSIKNADLVVDSPADSVTITQYTQTFMWQDVSYATRYRLQVCNDNFHSGNYIYDTTVTATQVSLGFQPGEYEWRLRAENSSSETAFHYGKIYVKKGDFTKQKVIVKEPAAETMSTTSSMKFSWEALYDTKIYIIEIDTITGDFSDPMFTDTVKNALTSIKKVIPHRGDYWWRIKAISSSGEESLYTTPQTFYYTMADIDLLAPKSGAKTSMPATFNWSAIDDVKNYKLYIYQSDSVTVIRTQTVTANSASISDLDLGRTYFWTVTALDNNGYPGSSSERTKFTVNP